MNPVFISKTLKQKKRNIEKLWEDYSIKILDGTGPEETPKIQNRQKINKPDELNIEPHKANKILDQLREDRNWINATLAKVRQNDEKAVKALEAPLEELLFAVETTITKLLNNTKVEISSKLERIADEVKDYLEKKKIASSISVGQMTHVSANKKNLNSIVFLLKNVKTADNKIIPELNLVLSETKAMDDIYITLLSSISTDFLPRAMAKNLPQVIRQVNASFALRNVIMNSNALPMVAFKGPPELKYSQGVYFTKKGNFDPLKVAIDLFLEIRKKYPNFKGDITPVNKVIKGEEHIVFISNKKLKTDNRTVVNNRLDNSSTNDFFQLLGAGSKEVLKASNIDDHGNFGTFNIKSKKTIDGDKPNAILWFNEGNGKIRLIFLNVKNSAIKLLAYQNTLLDDVPEIVYGFTGVKTSAYKET